MGNEANLLSCGHSGFGVHHCSHHEDAGVNCSGIYCIAVRPWYYLGVHKLLSVLHQQFLQTVPMEMFDCEMD